MKKFFLFLIIIITTSLNAQEFSDYFENATLRLDYIFGGNAETQLAFLHKKTKTNIWYGRIHNLSSTPIRGQASLKVYDIQTKKMIYTLPFGSLFQEWQTVNEAKSTSKSFEQSLLIPCPKRKVEIILTFFDKNHKEHEVSKVVIDPNDSLIKKSTAKRDYKIIHKAKIKNPIRVAFLAEGYMADEMNLFYDYAKKAVTSFFNHQVYKDHKDYFEFIAVPLVSVDSGVSDPSFNLWKNTVLNSHFNTFYMPRYLTTPSVHKMHQDLENLPYNHIIILANTNVYGGGGILNSYSLTTTKNPEFMPVVVHEFGHSFAGLGDEYFYANDKLQNKSNRVLEPWEKNITSLVNFKLKWKNLVDETTPIPTPKTPEYQNKIGAYEGLEGNGLYIPFQNCRMRTNDPVDFCKVCSNGIDEMIKFYTNL